MKFRIALFAVAAALFAAAGHAETVKDPLLDHMTGQWVLTGTIAGQQTTHDIAAEWVLQNTYVRLIEVSREKDAAGNPQYEAEVLVGYDAAKKRYVCFWFDITGIASPNTGATAVRDGDSLPFLFKIGASDFHTTFTWQAKSASWSWTMDGEEGGKLQPFARVTLKRK
jgi:hypothetical protein